MPLSQGIKLNNRYRIEAVLGQGGMGAVYRAYDENLGIEVAVKENLFLTDEYSRQFQREALVMATLRHPNLPRVGDYFILPGQGQYLIMDYIQGEDLRERIERLSTVPETEVVLIGAAICEALSYLHSRNPPIIHRDIKPGNIKITPEGEVILVDFGLVKVMEDSQQTITGARAMTPGYSPPEQYGTAHTDARSDIYSLGSTLYAALTGTIPEDALERATGKTSLTPIRQLEPKISRRVAAVVETALEVDPEDRFQSAEDFKNALLAAAELSELGPRTIHITPPPNSSDPDSITNGKYPLRPSRPANRKRKNPVATFVIGLIFIAALAAGAVSILQPEFFPALFRSIQPMAALPLSSTDTPTATATQTVAQTLPPTATEQAGAITETLAPVLPSTTPAPTNTPTATPTTTATPVGGGTAQIAFSSDRNNGVWQIYLMNSTGGDVRQITNMRDGACQISWAPDGKRFAFISPCKTKQDIYPNANIYIQSVDSFEAVKMPQSSVEGDFDPAWSPDGDRIAFTSLRSKTGKPHIYLVNLKTSQLEEISEERYAEFQPAWDPSGMNLAVVRQIFSKQIFILPTNGAPAWQFSNSGDLDNQWPSWSSDGSFLIYSQSQTGGGVPRLLLRRFEDRDNSNETRIPSGILPVAEPSLSPDMQWIVFESWPDGTNHDIYLINISGAPETRMRLTKDPGYDFSPAWRPSVQP